MPESDNFQQESTIVAQMQRESKMTKLRRELGKDAVITNSD